jgi:hypothetical protein
MTILSGQKDQHSTLTDMQRMKLGSVSSGISIPSHGVPEGSLKLGKTSI